MLGKKVSFDHPKSSPSNLVMVCGTSPFHDVLSH